MTIEEMIKDVQARLGLDADGIAGIKTWTAVLAFLKRGDPKEDVCEIVEVDPRSEGIIKTLLPQVQPVARALVHQCQAKGITIKIISGTRTYEEQNALYAQGRTKPGKIVTKARGGTSCHNFGISFDVGLFDGDKYIPESPIYKTVGGIGKSLGLAWGGDWVSFKDEPHFDLRPPWASGMHEKDMLAKFRQLHDNGQPIFA